MKILVDLDGTVFKTYEVIGRLYKKRFKEDLDWSVISDANLKIWKTDKGKWLVEKFKDPKLNANLPIYKDADKVLQAFAKKKGNQIIYCTARRPENWGATYKAFKKNNIPPATIIFLMRNNVPEMKKRVAKAFDINLAIDDELVNVKALESICQTVRFNGVIDNFWKGFKEYFL